MRCPICKTELPKSNNPSKPFCSARCKSIDLGKWLTEDYRVPTDELPDVAESAQPPDSRGES